LPTYQTTAKEIRLFGLGNFLRGRMLTEMRSIQRGQRALDRRLLRVEGILSLLSSAISASGLLCWPFTTGCEHSETDGPVC
jgi:ATP-binding cassette subfamily B protein